MSLAILNVAYPLAPVASDTAGGAEQMVRMLDGALCRAGHESLVITCAGSSVAGSVRFESRGVSTRSPIWWTPVWRPPTSPSRPGC